MEHVHVRFLRYSAFYAPLLLALEPGALRAEGLRATSDRVEPGRTIEGGLADGSVQVAQSAPAVSFRPSAQGAPLALRHFALMNDRDGFFLVARDGAAPFAWASLEGRSVLVDPLFQPRAFFFAALRARGVDARRVQVIESTDPAALEAAFRAGQGDFAHLQGPAPQQLEHEGFGRVVASIGDATGPVAFSSLCALPAWLGTDAARAFFRVYRRARAEARATPPSELARRLAPALPGIAPAALEATLAAYQRLGTWDGDERVGPELFARTVDVFVADGYLAARPAFADVFTAPPSP